MRWAISISLGLLFLTGVFLMLSPVGASSVPETGVGPRATTDFPLFPAGERIIAPGVGASPGSPLVDPRTGEVLICRRGGTTVVSGVEVASVIPGYCVMDVDPQTGRRFAAKDNELAALIGDQAVLSITFPYTVTSARYNLKNGLLYAVHCKSGYFPECTLAVVQGSRVAYTMSLGAYGGRPEVHPDNGLTYVPAGNAVKVLSGIQVVASLPVSGPVRGVRFHPYSRLVYAWGGYVEGQVAAITGTAIQSVASVTSPVDLAPDPNRGRIYVIDSEGRLYAFAGTTPITTVSIVPGLGTVDVVSPTGEIVVGIHQQNRVYIFPLSLVNSVTLSTRVPPYAVRAHPSGRVYVVERDTSYPPPEPFTGLTILSGTTPLARLPSGYGLGPVVVRPDTGVAYALDTLSGTLYLLSGTQVLTSVGLQPWMAFSLMPRPESMALDPETGMVYVGHRGAVLLWVINGTEVQTLSLSGFSNYPTVGALAADPVHGVVYAGVAESPQMLLISGTEVLTSVEWTGWPQGLSALAVDPGRGWLYGLGRAFSVAVFSVTTPVTQTFWVTSVNCGITTFALAVQPASGLAYAGCGESSQGFVQILNGPDLVAQVPVSGYAKSLAADPTTGWVYGALSGARSAAVFSGTEMYTVPLPFDPDRAWFNPVDGMGYIAGGSRVAVLEGPRLQHILRVGIYPDSLAFDPVRGRAYLTHYGDNRVIVFGNLPYKTYLPLVLRAQ
ncbi:MAG: hypothetical protein D6793_02575 [Thermoflexia bacterium]|nr:MAG: hypothetical protein D6793_02575 [Thermoflexia bacterium]